MSKFSKLLEKKLKVGLEEAANTLAEAYKADVAIDVEYTGSGVIRSQVGEFPRREFGQGQASTGYKMVPGKLAVEVGVEEDAWYMLYLEQSQGRLGMEDSFYANLDSIRQAFIEGATR